MRKIGLIVLTTLFLTTVSGCTGNENRDEQKVNTQIETTMDKEQTVTGKYKATKTIDVMNCDITVEIELEEDKSVKFYRAPMIINMEGGKEMPELRDVGTYVIDGENIKFSLETLGEFTAVLTKDGKSMTGKIPTGGPSTDMTLFTEE